MKTSVDGLLYAPATERNREAILEILRRLFSPTETTAVLEIASGTGQHATFFAKALPSVLWHPSDPDELSRESIAAWTQATQAENVAFPLEIDVCDEPWPISKPVDAVVCINMIHIAPWEAALALFRGARRVLKERGLLYLYGPYKVGGLHTAPSNERFDQDLRTRDPLWGVRDLEAVVFEAAKVGFSLKETIAMPANNFSLVFSALSEDGLPALVKEVLV